MTFSTDARGPHRMNLIDFGSPKFPFSNNSSQQQVESSFHKSSEIPTSIVADIRGPQGMNLTDSGSPGFHLSNTSSHVKSSFHVSSEIFTSIVIIWLLQIFMVPRGSIWPTLVLHGFHSAPLPVKLSQVTFSPVKWNIYIIEMKNASIIIGYILL